jgi:hypothetical protein
MPVAHPRRVAGLLLRFAIWIAPHDTLDWGHGMLSELNHVHGDWAALIWAMGGAGILAKHTLLSLILPESGNYLMDVRRFQLPTPCSSSRGYSRQTSTVCC